MDIFEPIYTSDERVHENLWANGSLDVTTNPLNTQVVPLSTVLSLYEDDTVAHSHLTTLELKQRELMEELRSNKLMSRPLDRPLLRLQYLHVRASRLILASSDFIKEKAAKIEGVLANLWSLYTNGDPHSIRCLSARIINVKRGGAGEGERVVVTSQDDATPMPLPPNGPKRIVKWVEEDKSSDIEKEASEEGLDLYASSLECEDSDEEAEPDSSAMDTTPKQVTTVEKKKMTGGNRRRNRKKYRANRKFKRNLIAMAMEKQRVKGVFEKLIQGKMKDLSLSEWKY